MATGEPSEEAKRRGQRIRELRESKGWTPQELGDAAGFGRRMIHAVEAGERGQRLPTIRKIAAALGVDVSVIMGEEPATPEGATGHAAPTAPVAEGVYAEGRVTSPITARMMDGPLRPGDAVLRSLPRVPMLHPDADPSWFALRVMDEDPGSILWPGDILLCQPATLADVQPGQIVIAATDMPVDARIGRLLEHDGRLILEPLGATGKLVRPGVGRWRIIAHVRHLHRDLDGA